MRSRRICGDPGGLRGPPIVDGGGGGEVLPVCDGESDETSSGVTQELGGEPPPKSEGAASMTKDSAGTEWTDEKHRSYLNSMEASFVRELYDQDCFSEHLPNLLPKKRKVLNQTRSTTCGSPFSQFKVLQEGCWQKIKFNDISARSDAVKDKWQLLTNPWIQHFAMTSSSKMHTATPLKFSGRAYWASEKRACCEWNEGVSSSSKINVRQIPADCSQKNELQNYANITEVSDQNFSEEGKRLADGSQTKKLQKWNPQSSGVDKVMTT